MRVGELARPDEASPLRGGVDGGVVRQVAIRVTIRARATVLLLLLALAACANREGVLAPVPPGQGAERSVEMLVATTRAESEAPGVLFSGDRGRAVAYADLTVSIPPNRPVGSIQWPSRVPPDPAREFAVTRVEPLSPSAVTPWFQSQPRGHRRALVFVHGFNTRFDAAVFRFAQFVNDTDADLIPVLFSWPSRGRILDYVYDRESTNFSRSDLAYVLASAARSSEVDEVVVLAHSMGAWLTMEALRDLALRDGRVPAKITNVVLASPDLDIDVFERQMQELGPVRPQVTIFVSRNDHALGLSRLIAGQVTRIGAVDVTNPAYKARLEGTTGVTVLDLTALKGGDALNHSKFATSPDMVRLLGERLVAGQIVDDSNPSAGGVVQSVGTVVGGVVSAPILILGGAAN